MLNQIEFLESIAQCGYQALTTIPKLLLIIETGLGTGVRMKVHGNAWFVFGSPENHLRKIGHHRFDPIEVIEWIDDVEWLMATVNYVSGSGTLWILEEFHISHIQVR